jgi:hypothetical protein
MQIHTVYVYVTVTFWSGDPRFDTRLGYRFSWIAFVVVSLSLSRPKPTSIYLSMYGSAVLLLDLGRFFSFLLLYTFGRTPWTGDQSVARPLPTQRTTQTQNKLIQTSMPWLGLEPTIQAFERPKMVHALDRAATVIRENWHSIRSMLSPPPSKILTHSYIVIIFPTNSAPYNLSLEMPRYIHLRKGMWY